MSGLTFKPELAKKAVTGQKTQTRRRMSDNPRSPWFRERCGFQAGEDYAVQPGRGKKAIGRVLISQVKAEPLGRMTDADAIAEGFGSLPAFDLAWEEINGTRPCDTTKEIVWVLTFRSLEDPPER